MKKISAKPKLTDWFAGDIKPSRPGIYQRRLPWIPGDRFAHWDGRRWSTSAFTADRALQRAMDNCISGWQLRSDFVWRGVMR